jgi:hypothetical protein
MTAHNNHAPAASTDLPSANSKPPSGRHGLVRACAAFLFVLLLGPAGQSAQAQTVAPAYGMTFTFLSVDESKVNQCATASRGATIQNSVFITRYDQPEIRSQVQSRLVEMRRSGFQEVRLVLYFGPDAKSRDWFDLNDAHRAASLLSLYVGDVKAAGFSRFFLAFSGQGTASPICRNKAWGDCWDPATTSRVNDFMSTVRSEAGSFSQISMRFDLALEMCAPPDLPELLKKNLLQYSRSVINNYSKKFPKDETTISCNLARFPKGRRAIDESYESAGLKPGFYDIHAYHQPDQDAKALTDIISADLKTSTIPVLVGEISYGDRGNLQTLTQGLAAAAGGLPAIYFWPLKDYPSSCHADVAPPYTLRAARGE